MLLLLHNGPFLEILFVLLSFEVLGEVVRSELLLCLEKSHLLFIEERKVHRPSRGVEVRLGVKSAGNCAVKLVLIRFLRVGHPGELTIMLFF